MKYEVVGYYQKKYKLPALAVVLVKGDQVIEKSAIGKRSINADIQVTTNDQWHIGSRPS